MQITKALVRIMQDAVLLAGIMTVSMLVGCGSASTAEAETKAASIATTGKAEETDNYADTITLVWYPNESADDFGASRSYGYERVHLGHDMMGVIGTPVIAIVSQESVNLNILDFN